MRTQRNEGIQDVAVGRETWTDGTTTYEVQLLGLNSD